MAPFNFKKKLTNKDKKSPSSNSTSPSAAATPPKESTGNAFQTYLQKQQQQPHPTLTGHNKNGDLTNSTERNLQYQQLQRQPGQQQSEGSQYQQPHQRQHMRVYPTPVSAQQRNVSGASTNLPQNRREYTPWNRIKLHTSPFPRYRHVASTYVSDNNRLFVIGGLHDESVYGDTWIITANDNGTAFSTKTIDISDFTPPPRVGHAATLCGNAFVLFGGDTHKVNSEGLMDDDIYLFNINSYKWTIPQPIGPRPLGRYGHKISIIASNQLKTKLYLFGGQFDDTYFNDLAVYDLSSFRRPDSHWEFLKPKTFVPPPLTNHTMVSYDNKLWVFGGDTLQGLINQVFMYDTISNDWTLIETSGTKPPPMQEHAALLYKDLMCVVGGKDDQDVYMNDVYFLNLKSLKWFKFPTFRAGIPQGRSGHSVTLLQNDKILIMGGDKFDYARPGENDLVSSDTDMGRGTLLYTLDLFRLEELCPDIYDVSEYAASSNPTTPPINNNMIQASRQIQPEPILTPYANDFVQTPIISRTPATNIETPQSKVLEISHDNDKVVESSPIRADNPLADGQKIEAIKKPLSPIPALGSNTSLQTAEAPRVVSLGSDPNNTGHDNTTEEEVGVATMASSPFRGDVKYDSFQTKENPQNDLRDPALVSKASNLNEPSKQLQIKTNRETTMKDSIEMETVKQLRSELEALRLETEKKAADAAEYIADLEKTLETSLHGTINDPHDADVMKMQTRVDNLVIENKNMCHRIAELQLLIQAKFLDAETLNRVIKEQNSRIEELEKDPSIREEFEDMKQKYELSIKENESLKTKLNDSRLEFQSNVVMGAKHLDTLISRWKIDMKSQPNANEDRETIGNEEFQPFYFGDRSAQQEAVTKMQEKLDKAIDDHRELKEANDEISSKYDELKLNYDNLTKEYQEKKAELETNYNETINSSTNTTKALEMSQAELEKYQKTNKRLQEELEELKYSHDSSNGEVSMNSINGNVSTSSTNLVNGQTDLNIKFNRYNMKINDLKAELYIMRQERDNLKKEVIELKKKQLSLDDI